MSSFDKELTSKIAKLARIKFDEGELEKISKDLGEIWEVIAALQQVNTENVQPISNVNQEPAYLREDIINDGNCVDKILANSKHQNFNCFTVPKVIE